MAAKAELPIGGVVGVPEPFGAFLMRPHLQQLGGFKARAFLRLAEGAIRRTVGHGGAGIPSQQAVERERRAEAEEAGRA